MSKIERGNATDTARRHYRDVTDRIATLLNDAEDAAEQIRGDARKSATRILREAEERALARVEELTSEPERLRNVAEDYSRETHASADEYSDRTRRAAEEQARQIRAEAQHEAEAMRTAAEEFVARIEAAGRSRQDELREETRALEEGRNRMVAGLGRSLKGLQKLESQFGELIASASAVEEPSPSPAPAAEPDSRGWLGVRRKKGESGPENGEPGDVYETLKQSVGDQAPAREDDEHRDLYQQAQELGIKDTSQMTKAELVKAIEEKG